MQQSLEQILQGEFTVSKGRFSTIDARYSVDRENQFFNAVKVNFGIIQKTDSGVTMYISRIIVFSFQNCLKIDKQI